MRSGVGKAPNAASASNGQMCWMRSCSAASPFWSSVSSSTCWTQAGQAPSDRRQWGLDRASWSRTSGASQAVSSSSPCVLGVPQSEHSGMFIHLLDIARGRAGWIFDDLERHRRAGANRPIALARNGGKVEEYLVATILGRDAPVAAD